MSSRNKTSTARRHKNVFFVATVRENQARERLATSLVGMINLARGILVYSVKCVEANLTATCNSKTNEGYLLTSFHWFSKLLSQSLSQQTHVNFIGAWLV